MTTKEKGRQILKALLNCKAVTYQDGMITIGVQVSQVSSARLLLESPDPVAYISGIFDGLRDAAVAEIVERKLKVSKV